MDIKVYKEVCKKAVNYYGDESQKQLAQEECAELIQAISKNIRGLKHNVEEEIADVTIMLEQLTNIYDMEQIDKWIGVKIDRLNRRMDEGQYYRKIF